MKTVISRQAAVGLASLFLLPAPAVLADSGFFIGGNIGNAALEVDFGDEQAGFFRFDESDFAWKAYGGYVWDLPVLELGIEGGYVDFGSPSTSIEAVAYDLDPNGWNLWGTAGIDIGPIGVFAKLGYIAWDVKGNSIGEVRESISEDGSDIGYGIGIKAMVGSLQVRAEFESYDIEDAEKLDMLSAGLVWHFN